MAVMDVFFGKTEERLEAERTLRQREDDLMAIDDRELLECPVHARADGTRLHVVLSRLRVIQTTGEQNSNRNLLATIIAGAIVVGIIKGPDFWSWAIHLL